MRANERTRPEPAGSDAAVSWRIDHGTAFVELRNTAQRNALTRAMCDHIVEAFAEFDARSDISVVVLRGAERTFCSGIAITQLREVLLDDRGATMRDHLSEADAAIRACRAPVIAAVEGFCFGGGWQIASACDVIVSSSLARFAITPSKLGIIYPRTGLERLVRLVGPANAKYLLATGAAFGAERAREYGLIAEVYSDDDFDESLRRLVATLARRSQFSVRATISLIDSGERDSQAAQDALWSTCWAEMADGEDLAVGIAAFTAHHDPVFTWRPTTTH